MGTVFGAKAAPTTERGVATPILVNAALLLIHGVLEGAKHPVVAWSAGKDSQVMLHLVRKVRPNIRVLHLRGFENRTKHAFAAAQAVALGLTVMSPLPADTDLVAKGDHVELVEEYRLAEGLAFYLPIEAQPGHVPGPDSLCAVEKLNQPTIEKPLGVDCVFVGHRSDDVDPVHGAIPLDQDLAEVNGVRVVYPLRNWTEANIWEASELLNIPQNKARYERNDMSANPDYFAMCTECLKPTDQDSVICPKTSERVYALGKHLDLEGRREEWRGRFVNLKKEQS